MYALPQLGMGPAVGPGGPVGSHMTPVGPPPELLGYGAGPLPPAPKRGLPTHVTELPAKKQSKWSPEEDALITELRGKLMKWEDISKRLPGRSAISCRLHYQNYLERRPEWDEERKNKLARLYERFKPEMWQKVAEELQMPWRAVEAQHWEMGKDDMAKRAGIAPFVSLTSNAMSNSPQGRTSHRGHGHSHSQGSVPRDIIGAPPRGYSTRAAPNLTSGRALGARRDTGPPAFPPPREHGDDGSGLHYGHPGGGPLAPIQTTSQQRQLGMLPGLAELTTGVSPYNTPAWSSSAGMPIASPIHSTAASPSPFHVPPPMYPPQPPKDAKGSKRRRSPDLGQPEPSRRRTMLDPRHDSIPRHLP